MKRHDESISDRLRRMAATDELKVGRGRAEQIAARALARVEARPHRRVRLVAAIVSGSAFAFVSVTGVGALADHAVPGDSLYPVDRAYESISRVIGREVDRTQERLEEALVLAQRGDQVAAANHVNTELGQQSSVIAVPNDMSAPATPEATVAVVEQDSADQPATAAQSDTAPAVTPDAALAAADASQTADLVAEEQADESIVLAIENAIRAIQEAADSQDEQAVLAADEAVQSVVKLAAGQASAEQLEQAAAPGAVTVATTTTTSAPEEASDGDVEEDPDQGETLPGDGEDPTASTTTTSVPVDDSEEEPPGDGETAGDDSSGSQEGSGSAGEPGDDDEQSSGPVILPIP